MKCNILRKLKRLTLKSIWTWIGARINYFQVHFVIFCLMALLGGVLIYVVENEAFPFIDTLFMACSAVCVTGGTVLASAMPVFLRWRYFRRYVDNAQKNSTMRFPYARALVGASRKEYRALTKLLFLVPLYIFVFQFLVGIMLFIYAQTEPFTHQLLLDRNINSSWFAAFHSVSAFNNAGFSLLVDNMMQFQYSPGFLVLLMILIIAGNVGFPVILRGVIFILSKLAKPSHKAPFVYLLEHPRLCFTHLFALKQTIWLLITLLGFTILQWGLFMILDWSDPVLQSLPTGSKVINTLFTAISTRTAGFNSVDLGLTSPAVQVLTVLMMYISSYPVALSARSSTIDKSRDDEENEEDLVYRVREKEDPRAGKNQVKYQAKNLIFRDVSYLFIGLMIIAISEDRKLVCATDNGCQCNFSQFKVLYELVSAYGTVGLTVGIAGINSSFSTALTPLSKFVIIAVMMLGRHRGLPLSIDHAVNFKSHISLNRNSQDGRSSATSIDNNSRSTSTTISRGVSLDGSYMRSVRRSREDVQVLMRRSFDAGDTRARPIQQRAASLDI